MVSKYRWPTIGCSGAAGVGSGFLIWYIFLLYTGYRTDDFNAASAGPVLTTCIEAASSSQIDSLGIDTAEWTCSTTSKDALAEILATNVHAMFSANNTEAYTGEAEAAFDATVLSVQGTDPAYTITRAGAYAALSKLGTPSTNDCDVLYPGGVEQDSLVPLPVKVACDDEVPAVNTPPVAGPDVNKLYTHCVQQFSYARSWPTANTFGIPMVGEEPKPIFLPMATVNNTATWQERQRILVGTRWGYSTIVYVLFTLTTAFFLMDSTILLLAELTRVDAYFAQNAITQGSEKSMKSGMMTMLATFQAKRNFRWAIALIMIIMESVLWVAFIGLPWQWGYSFARPACELAEADHWFRPFQLTTLGGWKRDYDTFYLELIVILSHLTVAIALPISTMFQRGTGTAGARDRTGGGKLTGYTGVATGSLRSSWWFAALALGALVIYVGQALAAFKFGWSWAEGVTQDKFDTVSVGKMIYDHVLALLYLTITIGLALGSVVGRWILAGLSCTSFTIFLIWIMITVGGFVPIFFVSAYWMFWDFDSSQGKLDCAALFPENGFVFARVACDIRMWTYIVGICLILIAVIGPVVVGLVDYSRVACLPRRRAWVNMPAYWRSLVNPANPEYRTFASANEEESLAAQPLVVNSNTGYRSANTSHFNWELDKIKFSNTGV